MTFGISGGNSIEAILVGSSVSFSAPADYNGSESFTISVTDGELEDSQNITVTVNAVNDAPVAQSLNIGIQEDESIVIQLVGSDVDTGTILEYILLSSPENGSLSIDGSLANYIPNQDFNGTCLLYTSPSPRDS